MCLNLLNLLCGFVPPKVTTAILSSCSHQFGVKCRRKSSLLQTSTAQATFSVSQQAWHKVRTSETPPLSQRQEINVTNCPCLPNPGRGCLNFIVRTCRLISLAQAGLGVQRISRKLCTFSRSQESHPPCTASRKRGKPLLHFQIEPISSRH